MLGTDLEAYLDCQSGVCWSCMSEDTILTVGSLEEEEKEDRGREKKREIY